VIIRGVPAPVVGTVSMNLVVADVTALENSAAGVPEVGETVTLIGGPPEHRISVEDVAEKSGTIPYVVTTQLGRNVVRRFRELKAAQPAAERGYLLRGAGTGADVPKLHAAARPITTRTARAATA
jgi:hypothetical protein